MSDSKVTVYTPGGQVVGYFLNPEITMVHEHDYTLSGNFYINSGDMPAKIDFNPEALPYSADISEMKKCAHTRIEYVYVQRARQPIKMTGFCRK